MCDTLTVMPDSNALEKLLFAKNSDRSPNEPHLMIQVAAKTHNTDAEPTFCATYIDVEQVPETLGYAMFKPSWTWGCEMGMNTEGVCIGNEAVFTKGRYAKQGLTGMDICRIVLERAHSALAGMELIGALLERYGQGGDSGYDHSFFYDNSYIVADEAEAYIVETAGKQWVAKKVDELGAISNALTIGADYEFSSEALRGRRVNFAARHTNGLVTSFSGAHTRRFNVLSVLVNDKVGAPVKSLFTALAGQRYAQRTEARGIDIETVKRALSMHDENAGKRVESPCMHYGGIVGDHTTGSFIAVPADRLMYATGASLPCLSVFKPMSMHGALPIFPEGQEREAALYWYDRELVSRNVMAAYLSMAEYVEARDELERQLDLIAEQMVEADAKTAAQLNADAFSLEQRFVDGWLARCTEDPRKLAPKGGSPFFKMRWNKKNAVFIQERSALLGTGQ